MENQTIKIEYKKFNSFLKDYLKMMNRGWLFMLINKNYNKNDQIFFKIKVAGFDSELDAEGTVIFIGENEQGSQGIGMAFSFNKQSDKTLSTSLSSMIMDRYGEWGKRICLLVEGK